MTTSDRTNAFRQIGRAAANPVTVFVGGLIILFLAVLTIVLAIMAALAITADPAAALFFVLFWGFVIGAVIGIVALVRLAVTGIRETWRWPI